MSSDTYPIRRSSRTPMQRGMVLLETYGTDQMVDVEFAEIPPQVLNHLVWSAQRAGRCLRCELMARLSYPLKPPKCKEVALSPILPDVEDSPAGRPRGDG